MITTAALVQARQAMLASISHGSYIVNGTEYNAEIDQKGIGSNNKLFVILTIPNAVIGGNTVSMVKIKNYNGVAIVEREVSIAASEPTGGTSYTIYITVQEDT